MKKEHFMKLPGNLLKYQGLKFALTVILRPRIPVGPLLGTLCLPQQTIVKPLLSTSRPCAGDQPHQVKPSTPMTTTNIQTCQFLPIVLQACHRSIHHS
ncbi:hypothetical protein WMY93_009021 [Mugilogobius chulae]|uniref:Uncharacterized protein n=1 Tax=Mugilogobius chulae TaxID=88201 RepID=A0AAW0PGS8_9GOBI